MKFPTEPATVEEKLAFILQCMGDNAHLVPTDDESITKLYAEKLHLTWEWQKFQSGLTLSNTKERCELAKQIGVRGVIERFP